MTEKQQRVASYAMASIWIAAVIVIALQGAARGNEVFHPGVLLWTAAGAATLYWSLGRILSGEQLLAARAIVFIDAVGSLQQAPGDVLTAGLIVLAFAELERRRELSAAVAITLATLMKLFPIAAAAFAMFRPYRVPRFAMWALACGLIALAASLLVVPPNRLMDLHQDWPNAPIQLVGAVILLAPLRRYWVYGSERFRLFFLASVLMFCVIFNHKAESATFIIATTGAVVWFATSRRTKLDIAAFAFFLIWTTLSSSDLMPEVLQEGFFEPYRFKIVPVLVLWVLTQVELWRAGSRRSSGAFGVPAPQTR